jgi:hypothetical protein
MLTAEEIEEKRVTDAAEDGRKAAEAQAAAAEAAEKAAEAAEASKKQAREGPALIKMSQVRSYS